MVESNNNKPDGSIPRTEDEIRKALGDDAPPPPKEEVKKEEEVVVTLSTGEVFKGKTEREVLDKIAKAKEEATLTIRDRDSQLRALQGDDKRGVKKEDDKKAGEFSRDTYYALFAEDPMAAFDYQMSIRLGVPPQDVGAALRYAYDTSEVINAHMENAAFRMKFPEAPMGDEFADKMVERMNERQRPWNVEGLGTTYLELVHEGVVKPQKAAEGGDNDKGSNPPPNLTGGGGGPEGEDEVEKARGMSTSELEKLLHSKGMM